MSYWGIRIKITCNICKKQAEKLENVSFYINWIEYEPNIWICRQCKENVIDNSLLFYKFSSFAQHIKKSSSKNHK
ncbi:MAG: hypothetical protein ACTSWR_02515 [Candidatus Helarchaeota archaeon]